MVGMVLYFGKITGGTESYLFYFDMNLTYFVTG